MTNYTLVVTHWNYAKAKSVMESLEKCPGNVNKNILALAQLRPVTALPKFPQFSKVGKRHKQKLWATRRLEFQHSFLHVVGAPLVRLRRNFNFTGKWRERIRYTCWRVRDFTRSALDLSPFFLNGPAPGLTFTAVVTSIYATLTYLLSECTTLIHVLNAWDIVVLWMEGLSFCSRNCTTGFYCMHSLKANFQPLAVVIFFWGSAGMRTNLILILSPRWRWG